MKQRVIFVCLLASSLVWLNTGYADSATDPQSVTLTVPEVALFAVENDLTITAVPPTQAGQNFTAAAQNVHFAITSNVEGAKTRVLNAKIDQILSGMDLEVTVFPAVGVIVGTIALTDTDTVVLNGIGNEMTDFTSPLSLINYELVPTPGANATLPYGDTVVQVTYTLEDDS